MRLTDNPAKLAAVRANLFPDAHALVRDWDTFPWHTRGREVDADVPWSSQAFCMSVWGTLPVDDARELRQLVGRLSGDPVVAGALDAAVPQVTAEVVDRELLDEKGLGMPTNLDAVIELPSLVVVVESKLSEPFGGCSQAANRHCSGFYGTGSDLKHGTPAACRLAVPDGRRMARSYWTVMDALSGGSFAGLGSRCPFLGPGYQVMRSIASAYRLGQLKQKDWRIVFAFPASLAGSTPTDIAAVRGRLLPEHQRRVGSLDYDTLSGALLAGDSARARALGRHMASRIAAARTR